MDPATLSTVIPTHSHVRRPSISHRRPIEHHAARSRIRNHTQFRRLRPLLPELRARRRHRGSDAGGAHSATTTPPSATNLFNQTDLTYVASTGPIRHTLLAGAEFGRQLTDNFRNTGFFNNTATSILVPFGAPTITTPVTFRQSATDADNHLRHRSSAAAYAQDQVELVAHLQVVGGLRFDRFDLTYHNNRNGDTLIASDDLVSPRVGVVVKPIGAAVDLWQLQRVVPAEFGRSVLVLDRRSPSRSKPEKFKNYEVGAKWDVGRWLVGDHRRLSPRSHQHAIDRPQRSDADRPDRQPAHQRLRSSVSMAA